MELVLKSAYQPDIIPGMASQLYIISETASLAGIVFETASQPDIVPGIASE